MMLRRGMLFKAITASTILARFFGSAKAFYQAPQYAHFQHLPNFASGATSVKTLSAHHGTVSIIDDAFLTPLSMEQTLLFVAEEVHHDAGGGLIDTILSNPAVWSLSIMLVLVGLLTAWENFVETVRETLPKTFVPVFEKMWSEVAGLGFIGLVLQVLVHPWDSVLGKLSEEYLGEEEILLESFEFLHTAFFQVGIAFFAAAGYMVAISLRNIEQIKQLDEIGINSKDGSCMATNDRLAQFLRAPQVPFFEKNDEELLQSIPQPSTWDEFLLSDEQRSAQALLVRSYWVENSIISSDYPVEALMERRFASLLSEMVELSPLTWIPLIPALALANAVDLSHDVVNAASPNALASAGFFFSTPQAILPSLAVVALSVLWGLVNFVKMAEIKKMVLPTIVQDTTDPQNIRILPSRYTFPEQLKEFSSSPPWLAAIEKFLCRRVEEREGMNQSLAASENGLFGINGGLELYLSSIRSQAWLSITSIVFFGTQIIPRDIQFLLHSSDMKAGDPTHVLPEFITYSLLVFISFGLLAVSPTTFFNYSLCGRFIEGLEKDMDGLTVKLK